MSEELEYKIIMAEFNKMSREELLKYIDEHLFFNIDYDLDMWTICADDLLEKED